MQTKTLVSDLQKPFFVYGTLRPGFGNDWLWHNVAHAVENCRISGYRLALDYGLPFAVRTANPDDSVIGSLIRQDTDDLDVRHDLLRSLDRLEGYPTMYDRSIATVYGPDGSVSDTAWVYHAPHPDARNFRVFAPNPGNYADVAMRR